MSIIRLAGKSVRFEMTITCHFNQTTRVAPGVDKSY